MLQRISQVMTMQDETARRVVATATPTLPDGGEDVVEVYQEGGG